eukprot:2220105-Amphidinium_carterae.1
MVEVILWLRNSPKTSHLVGARVIRVMGDGGGEFTSDVIKQKLLTLGVMQSFSPVNGTSNKRSKELDTNSHKEDHSRY